MSWERDPMSWERDKKKFTCPHSAAVIKASFQSFRFLSILRDYFRNLLLFFLVFFFFENVFHIYALRHIFRKTDFCRCSSTHIYKILRKCKFSGQEGGFMPYLDHNVSV